MDELQLSATEADVIVYGATPGGFCAAIAAAREGASVILLEPTAHVGGASTGGLCFSTIVGMLVLSPKDFEA